MAKITKSQAKRRIDEAAAKLFKVGTAVPLPQGMTTSMQVQLVRMAQDLQKLNQKI